jgi:tetratricopeptide (TPR) repeat protein
VTVGALRAGASEPEIETLPHEAGSPDLDRLWTEGELLEREGRAIERDRPQEAVERYLGAARRFEKIAREQPGFEQAYWRSARSYWAAGDALPLDAKEERIEYFELAEVQSSRGIEADPDCAECMLWKFVAMGRLRTTSGLWTSIRQLSEMALLLDRGIALNPTYADDGGNSTLGNLHYSSAIFYRVFPDWFWIGWLVGVKGDKDRALAHSRTALSIHPSRLDYQIEMGCQLLCLGSSRGDRDQLLQGMEVLRAAIAREPETQDDARELAAAEIMLEHPGKSCGYTGDSWVEIDRAEARRAALSPRLPR